QELIYRITRAIYDRLGASTDESIVEQLVTDIYRTVEPSLEPNGTARSAEVRRTSATVTEAATSSSTRIIISVFGMDHPGIVAGVAEILSEAQCSIIDINQTVVQGKFAMVIVADVARSQLSITNLKDRLRSEGEKLGVHIYAQREDLFNAMHRV
ncbi:MAG TPA: ACT domain-containing protein, partial [Pyrinomonadaceae bacterium]|nr:ACT domain-containing protein [Pyrinomonadaceae bacterium]